MSKKLIYLFSFVFLLSMSGNASADLIAHWPFDEGSGIVVHDVIGNVNDGQLDGDASFVNGYFNQAVSFDGDGDSIRWDDDLDLLDPGSRGFTVTTWLNQGDGTSTHAYEFVVSKGNRTSGMIGWSIWTESGNLLVRCNSDGTSAQRASQHFPNLPADEWLHVALVIDREAAQIRGYLNGDNQGWIAGGGGPPSDSLSGWGDIDSEVPLVMGQRDDGNGTLLGVVDDVRIFNHAMTQIEIQAAMESTTWPYAIGPIPTDGSYHEDTWVNLSWTPGPLAVSHDIYIGDNFDDVDAGAESTFVDNQVDTFIVVGFPGFPYPDGLVPGTTYYWRIDEVNDAEPNSPWKGDIWSFSVPPKTAYFPDPTDGAESVDADVKLSWTPGYGAKLHTVYFGETFQEVDTAVDGSPQGTADYTPGTLKMAKTYYWRVDEFDVTDTHKGDVWSFTTEGGVSSPNPGKGAVDVTQTPLLIWAPGLGATYDIYFGADPGALEKKASGSLGSESYEPGQLEWNTTYYWRIDEANSANADSPWTGPVWSFTTADFLIIDDMESYNDLDPADPASNRIFNAWIDGYGDPTNGSLVGYENPPFAEQTIVHSGNQSMPMAYDNSAAAKSEATLTLTSNRDWTIKGVNTLTIWFRGSSSNAAEQMYVTLDGTVKVDCDNPDAATLTRWTAWNINLQVFADQGVNLTNVNSITLGLSSVTGGTGTMYFDDIRLYPPAQ